MPRRGPLSLPGRYWARQSLRARLTLLATVLFALATATGAVLLVVLQRYALIRVFDASAQRSGTAIAKQIRAGTITNPVIATTGGVNSIQVLNLRNTLVAASPGADFLVSYLTASQLIEARDGQHFTVSNTVHNAELRVVAVRAGRLTVVVYTDIARVDDSVRVLTRAALIGAPIAVLLVALSTYFVVAITLRSVAALRHGAADIAAAGLSGQRLPVPAAQDEINRLAVTLNTMLDRIETATKRQRTFVGDAAHELRSPLASLRVQIEVTRRMGPEGTWPEFLDDVLLDVSRLDRLVHDLLSLARADETGGAGVRREPVELRELIEAVVATHAYSRVPVAIGPSAPTAVIVSGDHDQLHRVVVNLVDNAVRYAHTQVTLLLATDGSDARLSVVDDGDGLPEDERERVFDRFYRAEQSRSRDSGGTGLGLAIVRELVAAHDGTVTLQARDDDVAGLQAVVVLPLER